MTTWANRIIGYGEEAPDQLLANPRNFRIHPKHQQDALAGVLSEVGLVQNIIVNRTSGLVVDGHLRVSLALREGQPTVPVTYVELDESEENLILSTLDPLSALAGTDAAKLDELLREVTTGDAAVQAMLDGLAQRAGIVPGEPIDPNELWKGMPEFEQDDLGSWKSVHVHFANEEDYRAFAQLVEQTLTEQTRSIWYPHKEKFNHLDYQAEDEP